MTTDIDIGDENLLGPEQDFPCPTHGAFRGRPFAIKAGGTMFPPSCPACRDEQRQQSEAEAAQRAEQRKASNLETRKRRAGIPPRFLAASFANYDVENDGQKRAHGIVKLYAEKFEQRAKVGGSLVLTGLPGTGKTHLLCALGNHLVVKGKFTVLYTDCWNMVSAVKATYRKGSDKEEEAVIESFTKPDLLMIDEVGVQYGTDHERAIIHRVLDLRYQRIKPSIVAGNVDLEGMKTYLGDRAISRLYEGGGLVIPFDWEDNRKKIPKKGK